MSPPGGPGINVRAAAHPLFETPMTHAVLENSDALNLELAATIRARMAEEPGVVRSNEHGWHSDTDMLQWAGQPARLIAEAAIQIARKMTAFADAGAGEQEWSVKMWANVSGLGALNHPHVHPGVAWSAVYYVDPGGNPEADLGGEIFFEDPRFPMIAMRDPGFRMLGRDGKPQDPERLLKPSRGALLVFPAWLRHGVRPYRGDAERISVAMNIDVRLKL